jgi:PTH1 family peptidyl-tRNA hydrolase
MWLVIGLGNPGSKYLFTRHNIGFMALDSFLSGIGDPDAKVQFDSVMTKFKMETEDIVFAKPQTFMNKSGEPVQQLFDFYKVELAKLIVVHDDIDQPFGQIKVQKNRGHGGHNGIRSISEVLATQDYIRVKIGVGRPENPKMDVADYVLGKFNNEQQLKLGELLNMTSDAIESIIFDGFEKASTQFSGKTVIKEMSS